MGGIIHQTADYKNYKNAIGYRFRLYLNELVKDHQINLFAVSGIQPIKKNMLNHSYLISNEIYVIMLINHTIQMLSCF